MSAGTGQFSERLLLMRPIPTLDDLGGATNNFYKAALVWAKLLGTAPGAAAARFEQQRIESRVSYRFLIRRRSDITTGWQIGWRGRNLSVTALIEQPDFSTFVIETEEGTAL